MLEKLLDPTLKLVTALYKYFQEKPEIFLEVKGKGHGSSGSVLANHRRYNWSRQLIVHNDSAHLVRGIKLLRPFPVPWKLRGEIPTKLEPDQRMSFNIEAEIDVDVQKLADKYGTDIERQLSNAIFPKIVDEVTLEFELKNQHGRTVYQYSTFLEDGNIKTIISSNRRSKDSWHEPVNIVTSV